MSLKHLYGKIQKVTEQSDGTVLVEGIAQAEERDSVKELIRASAMRKAVPEFMKFANIREMHQPIAAGKAISCTVDDAGVTHLTALVIDAGSVAKVKAGVLQGFSIGGTVLKRDAADKSIIDELDLTEISLVDRPCLPTAVFGLCKIEKPTGGEGISSGRIPETTEPQASGGGHAVLPPKVTKAPLSVELRKSLFSVGWLAETLQTLDCLTDSAGWEAAYEGDSSEIPARLKAAVALLADILRDMAAEEAAELTGDQIAAAAQPGTLKKTEKLAGLLKSLSLAAKGVAPEAPKLPAEELQKFTTYWNDLLAKAAPAKVIEAKPDEALAKRASDAETALAKAKTDASEALAKVATLTTEKAEALDAMTRVAESLKVVDADRAELAKNLAAANVELTRKGVLRVVPIDKSQDGVTPTASQDGVTPTAEPETTTEQAPANPVDAMKKVHSGGGFDPFRLQQGASK